MRVESDDGDHVLVLDEDEFEANGLSRSDPDAAARARQALGELHDAARDMFRTLLGGLHGLQ